MAGNLALRTVQGVAVPGMFYGTAWKEERTEALTELALASGFTAIDTANQRRHYYEAAVGRAVQRHLARGAAQRQALFLQSKFTFADSHDQRIPYDPRAPFATQVEQSFASSLEHLGVSQLDAYLLHGPSQRHGLGAADWEVWRTLEALQQQGRTRLIGISNVGLGQLQELVRGATIPPALVQNRCFASSGWDANVRQFCSAHGILYQGFSLLTANQRELGSASLARLVQRSGRTLPQLVFRFAIQVGIIPLTGTSSAEHLRDDLACFDFELDESELQVFYSA